ncbi:hypothetical protein FXO38_28031 [Capsicum annuum]|nr:hypothetical protein FXO38_28031 [Capsicum annuum]KAF3655389.1 hypothetical protein FXO37_15967 [Capsicum annuum]
MFGATTITRKTILEGGLIIADGVSSDRAVGGGSGSSSDVVVGANDAPLAVFETTNHYVYDHTSFIDFVSPSEYPACKCQGCKAKHDGVINAINPLTDFVKELTSKRALAILDFQVDVTMEATTEQDNITVDNPSAASKDEEKNEELVLFDVTTPTYWNDEFIPINYGDEFYWVLVIVVLKERHICVYDSMSGRRFSQPLSEIQKLDKILPTYLDVSGFLDQKGRTDWLMFEAYQDKMGNPFDVGYVEGIDQDCSLFVAAYAEYLSNGLQVRNNRLNARLLHKIYATLLWKYREAKSQKLYAGDIKDPRRPKTNFIALDEEQLVNIE